MSDTPASVATVDPADRYDRLLAGFPASRFPPLIIAVGLDDRLLEALDRHGAKTGVLAIEPMADFHNSTARPIRRAWKAAGRLTAVIGPDYDGYSGLWRLISREALQPPMLVNPVLASRYPEQTERAKGIAKQIVGGALANEEARKRFAGGYLLNTLANLPVIAAEGDAAGLTGLFQDVPAIIVGAGPSLDATLPVLTGLGNNALVVAVDTAVRPLLAGGVHPHITVSVDPSETNARHLTDLENVRGLWFVAEASLTPGVFPQFAGRTFTFKVSNHEPWPWLAEHGADRATLQTWGSVLTTAFDVALRAGCNPIVFAGADLAYTRGLQYCRNTVFEPDWSPFPTDAERAEQFAKHLATRPHVVAPDVAGQPITTAPHFIQFRDWIVARAASGAPRRVINATGGGILYGGSIEQRRLEDVTLPQRVDGGTDIFERLAAAWRSTAGGDQTRGQLERGLAYGSPIPLDRWQAFTGDGTTLDQIRGAVHGASLRLTGDSRRAAFLARHRASYDRRIGSMHDAQELCHGDYDVAARKAPAEQAHVVLDYLQRTYGAESTDLDGILRAISDGRRPIRALDVGCGVGRLMAPLAGAGIRVDGVDVSERMLGFARGNPLFKDSSFFLTEGSDCGDAPDGAYDLVYSQLCFRYVPSRTVRNQLLRAMARAARIGGVVLVELWYFKGHRAANVPAPHVPWSADALDVVLDAGRVDTCPTPDELHLLYDDFGRYLEDIRLQFIDVPKFARRRLPNRVQLIVSGTVGGGLASRVHALPADDRNGPTA